MAEEALTVAKSLSNQAESLEQSVSIFKLQAVS